MSNPFHDEDPAWAAAFLAALPGMAVRWTSTSDAVDQAAMVADATLKRLAYRAEERARARVLRIEEARSRVLAQRTYTFGREPTVWTVESIDGESVRLTAPDSAMGSRGPMHSVESLVALADETSNFKPTP